MRWSVCRSARRCWCRSARRSGRWGAKVEVGAELEEPRPRSDRVAGGAVGAVGATVAHRDRSAGRVRGGVGPVLDDNAVAHDGRCATRVALATARLQGDAGAQRVTAVRSNARESTGAVTPLLVGAACRAVLGVGDERAAGQRGAVPLRHVSVDAAGSILGGVGLSGVDDPVQGAGDGPAGQGAGDKGTGATIRTGC